MPSMVLTTTFLLGGDIIAHIGANGCPMRPDRAGEMLLETVSNLGLHVINTLPGVCSGGPSRVQVRIDGEQTSTVDYALCSAELLPYIKSMVFEGDQMGSDHKPVVLTIEGIPIKTPVQPRLREVWRLDKIPTPPKDWSWVASCSSRFKLWTRKMADMTGAVRVTGLDAQCVSDVLEWSFKHALDGLVAASNSAPSGLGPRPPQL